MEEKPDRMGRFTGAGDYSMARLLWVVEGQSKGPSNGSTKTCVRSDTRVSNSQKPINREMDAQGTTLFRKVFLYVQEHQLHFLQFYFISFFHPACF